MSSRSGALDQGVGNLPRIGPVPVVESGTNEPERGKMQKIQVQQILDPHSSEGRKYQRLLMKSQLGARVFRAGLAPQFVTVDRERRFFGCIILTYTAWCKPYKVESRG